MQGVEIHYEPHVYRQIMHWVTRKIAGEAHLKEVSGFCKVVVRDNIIHATHAFLAPQTGSSVETDIEADDLSKLVYDTRNIPGELQLWFHSHPYMSTNWSTTDHRNMIALGSPGWFAATVFNDKWEHRSAIYQAVPFVHFVDEVPTKMASYVTTAVMAGWDEEFDRCVKAKPPVNDVFGDVAYEKLETERDSLIIESERIEAMIVKEKKKRNSAKKVQVLEFLQEKLDSIEVAYEAVEKKLRDLDYADLQSSVSCDPGNSYSGNTYPVGDCL